MNQSIKKIKEIEKLKKDKIDELMYSKINNNKELINKFITKAKAKVIINDVDKNLGLNIRQIKKDLLIQHNVKGKLLTKGIKNFEKFNKLFTAEIELIGVDYATKSQNVVLAKAIYQNVSLNKINDIIATMNVVNFELKYREGNLIALKMKMKTNNLDNYIEKGKIKKYRVIFRLNK
jgi:hypothetical protein